MFKVNKKTNKVTIPHTLRFDESLYEELQALASKENVAFNTLIMQCCKYALDNLESENENS